jgi:RimJ/RimL family protein N-acetyltransferase
VRRGFVGEAPTSLAAVRALIDASAARAADGLGLWVLFDLGGRSAGFAELAPAGAPPSPGHHALAALWPDTEGAVQARLAIAPPFWALGYAGEALRAVEHHAFDTARIDRLAAAAGAACRRSRRLLARAEYVVAGAAGPPGDGVVLYRKERPQRYCDSTVATVSIDTARRAVSAAAAAQSR